MSSKTRHSIQGLIEKLTELKSAELALICDEDLQITNGSIKLYNTVEEWAEESLRKLYKELNI